MLYTDKQKQKIENFKASLKIALAKWEKQSQEFNAKLNDPHTKPFQVLKVGNDFAIVRMVAFPENRLKDYTIALRDEQITITYTETHVSNRWDFSEFTQLYK